MSTSVVPRNVGEALLIFLKKLGVDFFFANPGTEFVSLIRAFHELPKEAIPEPILVPHEFQAVSMAYGNYLVSKRPQAVMTHTNVGAANALIGLIGAARMNIPLIFISGMTSQSERATLGARDKLIHWSQDTKDQGAIYREYVKWEIEIRDPSTVYDALDRAYAIATSSPCGPVAIRISRDILVNERVGSPPPASRLKSVRGVGPDREALAEIFSFLHSAKKPLLITNRLGLHEKAVSLLSKVAIRHGIGVVTPEDFYMSMPFDHAHHLGFRHGAALAEADLVVVLDTEAPWYPLEKGPSKTAKVVHVGPDPFFEAIPLRSYGGDIFLRCCSNEFLFRLSEQMPREDLVPVRMEWIHSKQDKPNPVVDSKLSAEAISSVLSEFLDEKTVLVNELSLVPEFLKCHHPGNYFRSGSASPLGWGVGCALGISLADRRKTVIAGIGDGVFYISPIMGALLLAVEKNLPLIILVLNNGGMASIAKTVRDFYPSDSSPLPLTSFHNSGVNLERCVETVSGLGIRATTCDELRRALTEGLKFGQRKCRPVVINAIY